MTPRIQATRRRRSASDARRARANHLERTYGLTVDQYAEMVARQSGVCAISGEAPLRKWLHVDHDHLSPERQVHIRGLLTFRANTALSLLRDRPLCALRAALYLVDALVRHAGSSGSAHPRYLSASEHVAAEELLTEITRSLRHLEQLTKVAA